MLRLYVSSLVFWSLLCWSFSAKSMKPSPSVNFEELGFCKTNRKPSQPLILPQREPDKPTYVPTFKVYSDDEEVPLNMQLLSLEEEKQSPRENFAQGVFAYTQKRYSEALECFVRAISEDAQENQETARRAMAHVQNRIGCQHIERKEYENAKAIFLESARNGNASALFNLGLMSLKGHRSPLDDEEALSQFKAAHELGHPLAQRCYWRLQKRRALAFYNNNNYEKALALLKQIKKEGYSRAEVVILETEFQMGIQLFRAEKYKEALEVWRNAISQGNKKASYCGRIAWLRLKK